MAESIVKIEVAYEDAAALGAWLTSLAADVTAGKVLRFHLRSDADKKVRGELYLPGPGDLTVAVEDPAE